MRRRHVLRAALGGAMLATGAAALVAQSAGSTTRSRADRSGFSYTSAASGERDEGPGQQARAGWLGIGLSCSNCEIQSAGKTVPRWVFTMPPEIYSVDRNGPADRAGLRRGDTLLTIDGQPFVSAEGGEAFANLRPGVRVRLGYSRDGRERSVNVTPVESPALRQLVARDSQLQQMARSLSRSASEEAVRAREQLARVQEEVSRNRGKILNEAALARIRESLTEAGRALGSAGQPFVLNRPGVPSYPMPSYPPVPPAVPMLGSPGPSRLRYSGRVGDVSVEARRAGAVAVVETGDSAIVLSGGDLTVRIAVERGGSATSVAAATGTALRTGAGDAAYGVTGYLVNARLAEALGVRGGVLALSVEPGSHADSLGIIPGDVVVELNDRPVAAITSGRVAGRSQPGALTAVVVRARERQTLVMPATPARPRAGAPRPATPPRPPADATRPPRRP